MSSQFVEAALRHLDLGCVIVRDTHAVNYRWANSAITTNGDTRGTNLTAIAMREEPTGARVCVVSGQVADVAQASALAQRAAAEVATASVVDAADLPAGVVSDDFDAPSGQVSVEQSDALLDAVGTFMAAPAGQFGYAEADLATTYLGTTSGTRLRHAQSSTRFEASARTDTASTWWGTNSLRADFRAAVADQTRYLGVQGHRGSLEPGRHPVILTPSAVADLMIYLSWSANGRDAVEGHNVFSAADGTRIGERLSQRSVDLFADPGFPGLECSAHAVVEANSAMESVFDNGLAIGPASLISAGAVAGLRASRPTAERVGLRPQYFADNLILSDSNGSGELADLIARTYDAVLITCLWYIREVDPQNLLLTGLTRDGVYRVRGGEVVESLPNFRFNVSPVDLLGHIADATSSAVCLPREWADWFTATAMPALLVTDFNLSSRSEAR